jgi:hypothetical protein
MTYMHLSQLSECGIDVDKIEVTQLCDYPTGEKLICFRINEAKWQAWFNGSTQVLKSLLEVK